MASDGGYRNEYRGNGTGHLFLNALKWLDSSFLAPLFADQSMGFLYRFSYAADRLLAAVNSA